METEIISILNNSVVPLTPTELRQYLRKYAIKKKEYEIIDQLRDLRNRGKIHLDKGRWGFPINSDKSSSAHSFPIGDVSVPANFKSTPSLSPIRSISSEWSPSTSKILNNDATTNPDVPTQQADSGWSTFRKLLGYYIDCVRNDEGGETFAYLTDLNKRFVFLHQIGNWYPQIDRPWHMFFPTSVVVHQFFEQVQKLGEEGMLVLGYPFQIFAKPGLKGMEAVGVKPIFTFQLEYRFEANGLRVWIDHARAEINHDWLAHALKEPEQQKMFLSACGLRERGRRDEIVDVIQDISTPDLKTLAASVTTFFGEKIREPLDPTTVFSDKFIRRPDSGIYNKAVIMIGNRTQFHRSLIKELNYIQRCSDEGLNQTSLRYIFKHQDINISEEDSENLLIQNDCPDQSIVETCPLNGEQRRATSSMFSKPLSLITGPPGTGKSQVASAAMLHSRLTEQNTLFASRNHKAIDAVVGRLMLEDRQSLVIRANSKDDPYLNFGFKRALKQLLLDEFDESSAKKWEVAKTQLNGLLDQMSDLNSQIHQIRKLRDGLGQLEEKLSTLSSSWPSESIVELEKAAGQYPSAQLDQLESKIGTLRKINIDQIEMTQRIKWWLKAFFLGPKMQHISRIMKSTFPHWEVSVKGTGLEGLCNLAQELPHFLLGKEFCALRSQAEEIEGKLKEHRSFNDLLEETKKMTKELEELTPKALALHLARWTGLPRDADREELASLKSALGNLDQEISDKTTQNAVEAALKKSLPLLLKHYPLWAVTNLSVGSRVPLFPALFELAILDEASQCDIPSAIPILFRAKRAGVIGDPHQLSHITNLKGVRELFLRKRHSILGLPEQKYTYPENSLYDLTSYTNQITPLWLRDTYRSVEEIAEYSNGYFYKGKLRTLTHTEQLKIPSHMDPGIHWTDIRSKITTGGPSGAIALDEIQAVLEQIKIILVENEFEGTVGVVTPFRQQANRIRDVIVREIPSKSLNSAQLIVDTANGFQGDERDVILMSLCVGPDMPKGSLNFIRENANLMNVAVSRARAVLHVIGNREWSSQSGIPHLERLVSERKYHQPASSQSPWHPHESPWEKKLYDALKQQNVETTPQFPVIGRRLDLAYYVENNHPPIQIDIEVDGDMYHRNPDGTRKADDIWRDIQLEGIGWTVIRFWTYELREDMESCVAKIVREISRQHNQQKSQKPVSNQAIEVERKAPEISKEPVVIEVNAVQQQFIKKTATDNPDLQELKGITPVFTHSLLDLFTSYDVSLPDAGYELSDNSGAIIAVAELAWPDSKIAFLTEKEMDDISCFRDNDWQAYPLSEVIEVPDKYLSMFTSLL